MNPSSQRGGFVTGLVDGLLIGLGVALAVAVYITKAPVPFINKLPQRNADQDAAEAQKNLHWDPNAPLAGKNPARAASTAAATASNVASDPAAMPAAAQTQAAAQPVVRAAASAAAPASAAASRSARDPAALLAGQPASAAKPATVGFQYWVQAGAYARIDDAETQRAKLAMLGLDAKVLEREQSGRVVYRVRVGPFDERGGAESAQTKLGDAGIDANLVRAER